MIDLAWIHINLGNVFLKKGLYNEAKKSCLKGKKIAKARDDNNSLLKANECLKEIKMLLL
jgi:tetratricopeptide repeat protein 19